MATFTNGTKQAAATFSNQSANAASPNSYTKAGSGINYDSHLAYDDVTDPISGNTVYYDTVGLPATWSNTSKT